MLSHRATVVGLALCILAATGFVSARPAAADYVYCPPAGGPCVVIVTTPGGPGGGGGSGGSGGCTWNGQPVDCFDPVLGWYDGNGCYYMKATAPPARPPGAKGEYYLQTCLGPGRRALGTAGVWLPAPPPRAVSPAVLAAQAINLLGLTGPDIGIVPKPGSQGGLVGLPVWMWTRVTPTTWGPNSATAYVPGLSVTATASASKIVWNMGDGHSVPCNNPGMAYDPAYGKQPSPKCGYTYAAPGTYTVTGTTYWHVTWAGGGQRGAVDVQRSSSTQIRIGELQVLVQ